MYLSILVTWIGLPQQLRYDFASWNPTTHGNITFVIFLMVSRYVTHIVHPVLVSTALPGLLGLWVSDARDTTTVKPAVTSKQNTLDVDLFVERTTIM